MVFAVIQVPPPAFYQAASGLLSVLLLSGVVAEMRARRDADGDAGSAQPAWEVGLFVVVCVVVIIGEVFALNAIVNTPPPWEQVVIGFAVIVGVMIVPLMICLSLVRKLSPRTPARRIVSRVTGGLFAATVVVVVVVTVNVVSSGRPGLGSPALGYRVAGTCANDACGLNAHTDPSADAPIPAQKPAFQDGDELRIVCQASGGSVRSRDGAQSRIWDQLADGLWVSDLFVNTPGAGTFTRAIPKCHGKQVQRSA